MPASKESNNIELFNTLKSRGYEPYPKTVADKETSVDKANLFVFKFIKNNQSYGPARVSIDKNNNLVLYTNDRLEDSPQSPSKNSDHDDSWNGLKIFLKNWSRRHGLKGFKLVNDRYLQSDMAMQKRDESKKLNEGYYPMGKMSSYNDSISTVKIVIQHTRQIQEGEQRYRNVARIFVENTNGERFLLPTKRPGIAKVYARHIAEGGTPYDERGKHISSLVEEYTKMAGFVRATRNHQFNESAQRLVSEGANHYQSLRDTLSGMISQRGYNKYFDNYTPVLNEETDDASALNELFVQETLDPRIESVLPILQKLSKNLNEMSEVKELAEWAESIIEVEDETTKTMAEPAVDELDVKEEFRYYYPSATKASIKKKIRSQKYGIKEEPAEDELNEISIATLKSAQSRASDKIKALRQEIQRLESIPWQQSTGPANQEKIKKYEKAIQHYIGLQNKAGYHPHKMFNINKDKEMDALLPAKLKKVAEAPGAETLAHNDSTEKSNLKAFDLAEGPADEPVEPDMNSDDKRWDDVEEGLDANQKRAGQLGPTEPVGKNEKNLRGKLVGASESIETDDLNRIKEMIGYK